VVLAVWLILLVLSVPLALSLSDRPSTAWSRSFRRTSKWSRNRLRTSAG